MTSTIQSIPVDPTPPASGEGLIFNGTVYVPTPANPGDITAVNTTLPLIGGGVSGALTLDINNFTGDSGLGGLDGAVPAPAAGDAAAGKFLSAGGGWSAPGGGLSFLDYKSNALNETVGTGVLGGIVSSPVLTKSKLVLFFEAGIKYANSGGALAAEFNIALRVDGVVVVQKFIHAVDVNPNYLQQSMSLHAVVSGLALGAHSVDVYIDGFGSSVIVAGSATNPTVLSVWEI